MLKAVPDQNNLGSGGPLHALPFVVEIVVGNISNKVMATEAKILVDMKIGLCVISFRYLELECLAYGAGGHEVAKMVWSKKDAYQIVHRPFHDIWSVCRTGMILGILLMST